MAERKADPDLRLDDCGGGHDDGFLSDNQGSSVRSLCFRGGSSTSRIDFGLAPDLHLCT